MVKQTQAPELTEDDYAEIADSIHRMGDMGRKLTASGLSKRAVLVLLHDASGVPMKQIKQVLEALRTLSAVYLQKAAGK